MQNTFPFGEGEIAFQAPRQTLLTLDELAHRRILSLQFETLLHNTLRRGVKIGGLFGLHLLNQPVEFGLLRGRNNPRVLTAS